jgi:hypothetical protein
MIVATRGSANTAFSRLAYSTGQAHPIFAGVAIHSTKLPHLRVFAESPVQPQTTARLHVGIGWFAAASGAHWTFGEAPRLCVRA